MRGGYDRSSEERVSLVDVSRLCNGVPYEARTVPKRYTCLSSPDLMFIRRRISQCCQSWPVRLLTE